MAGHITDFAHITVNAKPAVPQLRIRKDAPAGREANENGAGLGEGAEVRLCRKVNNNIMLSTIGGIFLTQVFQYMIWLRNFATEPTQAQLIFVSLLDAGDIHLCHTGLLSAGHLHYPSPLGAQLIAAPGGDSLK